MFSSKLIISQNIVIFFSNFIGTHLINLNHNYISDTRHKVTSSLSEGIPISPGEIITANTDVIIGKPGKLSPRPPNTFLNDGDHIGIKPPPMPKPNIPVHPVLEPVEDTDVGDSQVQSTVQVTVDPQIQILPAQQIYEEHINVHPVSVSLPTRLNLPQQDSHSVLIQSFPPKKIISSKQDILENDPLLKPPGRPTIERYPSGLHNINRKPIGSNDKHRKHWSAKDPIGPTLIPPSNEEVKILQLIR